MKTNEALEKSRELLQQSLNSPAAIEDAWHRVAEIIALMEPEVSPLASWTNRERMILDRVAVHADAISALEVIDQYTTGSPVYELLRQTRADLFDLIAAEVEEECPRPPAADVQPKRSWDLAQLPADEVAELLRLLEKARKP